ncbi:phostensin isoform X2 [Trichosurus vulpecula]|uniref:phostensin isoform X2 n=1 Tax=Trichosurus vulpecula TaxID=9337 RepID=UPI00186B1756|nr:phostensin isoform X2 [Trichosurus vulpecula]
MRAFSCPTGTMATVPDWKLQLLARRRQEEAAVRGREQAEKDRLAQMPAWKRGLLERRRAKLGVPVGEPGPGNEAPDAAPPEPEEPVVLLEAIGPVHQNRFIRQERQELKQQQQQQQSAEEQLTDRRPPEGRGHVSGRVEAREQRVSAAEAQEQSLVGRESREQRLSLGESVDRKLGLAEVQEQSLRPAEALEWRLSPRETEERSSGLSESRKWKKSPGEDRERNVNAIEPREQTSGGSETGECRLSSADHGEHGEQRLGLTEIHKWRMNSREVFEQSPELLEAREWRLNPGEESKGRSGELRTEQRLMQRQTRENSGLLETQRCRLSPGEFRERSPGVMEATEMRLNPGEDADKSSRQMEVRKWRLNSGKAREWSPGRSEAREQKTVHSDSGDQKLLLPGPKAEEGRTGAAVEEAGDGGRMVSSLRSHYPVTSPPPPEEVGTKGSGPQEEEAAEPQPPPPPSVSPLPPAPPTPQPPGDPLMSRLFYGVKPGPGVGAPRRSGHTFTVNPRRSGPPAAPAPPEPQVPGPGKKRYPTAEEILVLGGYLRLSRSCLAKGSPERHHKQPWRPPISTLLKVLCWRRWALSLRPQVLLVPPHPCQMKRRMRRSCCYYKGSFGEDCRPRPC